MTINTLLQFFVPKNKNYFPLFCQIAQTSRLMADKLILISNSTNNDYKAELVKEIYVLNDKCHYNSKRIIDELKKNFIAPFDREDILYMCKQFVSFTDEIQGASNRLLYSNISSINHPINELIECICDITLELDNIFQKIHNYSNFPEIKLLCRKICEIEHTADIKFDNAMSVYFDAEKDVILAIKFKEILSSLELTTDRAKAVALTIESIVIKYM